MSIHMISINWLELDIFWWGGQALSQPFIPTNIPLNPHPSISDIAQDHLDHENNGWEENPRQPSQGHPIGHLLTKSLNHLKFHQSLSLKTYFLLLKSPLMSSPPCQSQLSCKKERNTPHPLALKKCIHLTPLLSTQRKI